MENQTLEKIIEKLDKYRNTIADVGFASIEREALKILPKNEEELLSFIDKLLFFNNELNRICDSTNSSLYVCDEEGRTLRINKSFETMVKMKREDLLGENVKNIESRGTFKPSVCALTLRERKKVAVIQEIGDVKGMAVTGVPVFDEKGNLFRVITNAILLEYIESLTNYFKKGYLEDEHPVNGRIIAESDSMMKIIKMVDHLKDIEAVILIMGETGVGKGMLARYIHENSNRSQKKMVYINCGAIPDTLIESELFGYESGAFTGASRQGKQGLIEASSGGTLFLDEVSELPLSQQVKILDFIQRRTITRVGGTKEIEIDTRIIAASNKNLLVEVKKGNFRSDLFYRLNVIPITIPPLREREKDITLLSKHFLQVYNDKYKKNIALTDNNWNEILKYGWPGNIRELENYIERIVVTNDASDPVNVESLSVYPNNVNLVDNDQKYIMELKDAIEDLESKMISAAYKREKSSYKVAKLLGISQSSAYRKIQKYIGETK